MSDDVVLSAEEIDAALEGLGGWELKDNWLERTYQTPGWPHTLALTAAIGYAAESAWHHPDLELGYARVKVKLQTHRVQGITTHDTALASRIEEIATWVPGDESPLSGFPKTWVK
jgi:pterin-4a-carbinolamine dehydratase